MREGERKLVALGTRLAEQARENARLYEEARQVVRIQDEFLGVASHELKTPLAPLHLKLQGLRMAVEACPLDCQQRVGRVVEGAEKQLRKLRALVEELLDVSRLAEGRLRLTWEDVDRVEVARDVMGRFAQQAQKMNFELRLGAREPVVGRWDRAKYYGERK